MFIGSHKEALSPKFHQAIRIIDVALEEIGTARVSLGANMNRLTRQYNRMSMLRLIQLAQANASYVLDLINQPALAVR